MNTTWRVERWCVFELALPGMYDAPENRGARVVFRKGDRVVVAAAFGVSGGTPRIRFMPDEEGEWSYEVTGVPAGGEPACGSLLCTAPAAGNKGPVRVSGERSFAYADGTPYYPFGTTCLHGLRRENAAHTVASLTQSPFNKVRISVGLSAAEPELQALEEAIAALMQKGIEAELLLDIEDRDQGGIARKQRTGREGGPESGQRDGWTPDGGPEPVEQAGSTPEGGPELRQRDEWTPDGGLEPGERDRRLEQLAARFAAYRNVWWALRPGDQGRNGCSRSWRERERLLRIIRENDPYGHLLTIHSDEPLTDFGDRAITHVSLRSGDPSQTSAYAQLHGKPVILDECGCEGNAPAREASLPGEEMVSRIWTAVCRGGYAGHGEMLLPGAKEDAAYEEPGGLTGRSEDDSLTYAARIGAASPAQSEESAASRAEAPNPGAEGEAAAPGCIAAPSRGNTCWHTHGGAVRGEASARIAFLRGILEAAPTGLRYMPEFYDAATIGMDGVYYLQYFGIHRFPYRQFELPEGRYAVDIVDTWNMTVLTLPVLYEGSMRIELPSQPYYALRIRSTAAREGALQGAAISEKDREALRQRAEENDNFIRPAKRMGAIGTEGAR
ncbi:DUF5605 domain-containing protein [Paenibacillus hamazuiensis]|uniref:DUF5605 domain-containing protein n=1 Tax=Paenibacillus hamazuiensis TaxID=2936508 RepID=UPI00200EA69A